MPLPSQATYNEDPVLRTRDAAKYLGLSPATLANWRSKGIGVEYIKIGTHTVGYRKSALDRFLNEQ